MTTANPAPADYDDYASQDAANVACGTQGDPFGLLLPSPELIIGQGTGVVIS